MTEKKNRRLNILVRASDRARLELIRDTLGVSLSGAFRAALAAMSRQLGYEKELPDDFMKKK